MTVTSVHRLERAVAAICPDIQARIATPRRDKPDERTLWWELSSCILSSQVSYSLAGAAADAVSRAGLLYGPRPGSDDLAAAIEAVLTNDVRLDGRAVRYRFPGSRARHLATAGTVVRQRAGSLSRLLEGFADASEARKWLVDNVPGVGPKQASMFLRNIGLTYSFAILDRHVLNYMSTLGIGRHRQAFVSGLPTYLKLERDLSRHAARIGFDVGLLDWAIWIVMRADKESNMELDFA